MNDPAHLPPIDSPKPTAAPPKPADARQAVLPPGQDSEQAPSQAQQDIDIVRKAHADAMTALAADVHPISAVAIREHEQAIEDALDRLAERLTGFGKERDDIAAVLKNYRFRETERAERAEDALRTERLKSWLGV